MGWSYQDGITKQQLIREILEPWDFTVKPEDEKYYSKLKGGDRKQSNVLKHHLAGNSLWYLRETIVTPVDATIERTVWIGVSLLESMRERGTVSWGHKDMDISMGLYATGCPKEWANDIPLPDQNEEPYAYDFIMKLKGYKVERCQTCRKLKSSPEGSLFGQGNFCNGHENEIIVLAAWGDWHEEVPAGFVGVCACKGGRDADYRTEQYFLIPADEYNPQPGLYSVVDPERHQVWHTSENRTTKEVSLA